MKRENKERLYTDLIKYSRQIGILKEEIPDLVIDRKVMHRTQMDRNLSNRKNVGTYGECFWAIRTIFVDAGIRIKDPKEYKGVEVHKHKATYRDILHTLVHELVHYRFAYMRHGFKYEQRIKVILKGRTFPQQHVHLMGTLPKKLRVDCKA
jgi:hypothetical protein